MIGRVFQISFLVVLRTITHISASLVPVPLNIRIAVVGSLDLPNQASLSLNGPAFQMAVEELQERHGPNFNFTSTFIYDPKIDCPAVPDYVDAWAAKWFHEHQLPSVSAFIQPGCIGSVVSTMYALAAQWNKLLITCVAPSMDINVLRNQLPNSTYLSTGYVNVPAFADVYLNLMSLYAWDTVYMLLDENSAPVNRGVFSVIAANGALRNKRQYLRQIRVNNVTSFEDELHELREASRVCFFFGHGAKLRRLMIAAHKANMTNGQYVYFGLEVYTLPPVYGVFSWQYNDSNDATAREAFQSLLVVQPLVNPTPPSKLKTILSEFHRRSARFFNCSYPLERQPSQLILGCYLSVLFFGEVVVKAYRAGLSVTDKKSLIDDIRNRTFTDESAELYIDHTGQRRIDLAVTYFDWSTGRRVPLLLQHANASHRLIGVGQMKWPDGEPWPPLNEPKCGYRGEKCLVRDYHQSEFYIGICTAVLLVLGTLALVRYTMRRTQFLNTWWNLTATGLQHQRSNFDLMSRSG